MILFAWGQNNLQALARLALSVAAGGLIFLIPDGPYAPMLDDLKVNHLQMSLSGLGWAMVFTPAAMVTVAALNLERLARGARTGEGHFKPASDGFAGADVARLARTPYGHSWLLFGLTQIGNPLFFVLTLLGL